MSVEHSGWWEGDATNKSALEAKYLEFYEIYGLAGNAWLSHGEKLYEPSRRGS